MANFFAVIYDVLDEVVIDSSPNIRSTREEAIEDGKKLVAYINQYSEDYNDRTVSDVDVYINVNGKIDFSL